MDNELAHAQTLKYAEGLSGLYEQERAQRGRAEQALERLRDAYGSTVAALSVALELRDDVTGEHAGRVTRLALDLADLVAPGLSADPELEYGFLLHDVGKIGIPDSILGKPGPLTPAEHEVMCAHPTLGERIVAGVEPLQGLAREVVAAHHERWDGAGYPRHLSGDAIPLAARIFSLADSWDAMRNDRPYRLALSEELAREEIERGRGRQFDPELVDPFLSLVSGPVAR